ncbi:ROK family protein [Microbacterium sp. W1N]|uniref:ROK family protein n=1 Tax=Microbacterium festucae TaxID=2977531 RepID=UPI0021C0A026|nr:ROK family protein [Microbacterium festucae]MCT9819340.1 ROK family protein [Microbacterium festucae]
MKLRAGSKALIREINEALVLDVVRARQPVARAVIAATTGLSPATVTGITGKLLSTGLLAEADVVRGTGGRPARPLRLGRDAVFAAGVRLAASEAIVVLVDLTGEVVDTHREPVPSTHPDEAAAAIVRGVEHVAAARADAALIGVGVAVSGMVDQAGGVVRHSGAQQWEDVPLRALLADRLGVPVIIDSYVNALASGELLFAPRHEGRSLLAFTVGTSLGASVVVEGRIHRGFDGTAGGFAHWRADGAAEADRPCHCGATGCLETWASGWGLAREYERRGVTADTASDEIRVQVHDEAARRLGAAMANACKMFGPERVLVAVGSEVDGDALLPRAAAVFAEQFVHEHAPAPALDVTAADRLAFARGAAYEVLAHMFSADRAFESEADDHTERAIAH